MSLDIYYNDDQPFGPHASPDATAPKIMAKLVDQDNWINGRIKLNKPSLIVGRRGSGKTSCIYSLYIDKGYQIKTLINTGDLFTEVVSRIDTVDELQTAEKSAEIWGALLIAQFAFDLYKQYQGTHLRDDRFKSIHDFLEKLGVTEDFSLIKVVSKLLSEIRKAEDSEIGPIAGALNDTFFAIEDAKKIKQKCEDFMSQHNLRGVILVDSLEEYKIDASRTGAALKGLLHYVGRTGAAASRIHVCCCLPSEYMQYFERISSNPMKDFGRMQTIFWTPKEIVKLCARRFMIYLDLHQRDFIRENKVMKEDIEKGNYKSFLSALLPDKLTNLNGVQEDSVAYILRHTQLLPRHAIMILNAIAGNCLLRNGGLISKFADEDIRQGILDCENLLCLGVWTSYQFVYPNVEKICQSLLPKLGHVFSIGEFQKVNRQFGRGITGDWEEALQILIDVGAVGICDEKKDNHSRYITGVFSYTFPRKLVHGNAPLYCIHPIFYRAFHAGPRVNRSNSDDFRPILPHSVDLQ